MNYKKIFDLVKDELKQVEAEFARQRNSSVPTINEIGKYIQEGGGKRIRPSLLLLCTKLCGEVNDSAIRLASVVEFIHTATLFHDDVIDNSKKRRGISTAHEIWGNKSSVLVGDFLLGKSFELMVDIEQIEILKLLSQTASILIKGEISQLLSNNDISITEDDYLEIIKAKTSKLFATSCEVGALITNKPKIYSNALNSFGMNLGMTFQIIDDLLDYKSIENYTGKKMGNDFAEGKVTLPIILAYHRGNNVERKFWIKTIKKSEQKKGDFEKACDYLEKRNILNDIFERAKHYGNVAKDALEIFPNKKEKKILVDLIDFILNRSF